VAPGSGAPAPFILITPDLGANNLSLVNTSHSRVCQVTDGPICLCICPACPWDDPLGGHISSELPLQLWLSEISSQGGASLDCNTTSVFQVSRLLVVEHRCNRCIVWKYGTINSAPIRTYTPRHKQPGNWQVRRQEVFEQRKIGFTMPTSDHRTQPTR
jgi:hypothetical protein